MLKFLLITIICLSSLFSKADIVLTKPNDTFTNFSTYIYEDSSSKLSFEEVRKIETFKQYTNRISKGYSQSAFWLKFSIKNSTNESLEYYLAFSENFQNTIDCYILSDNNSITHLKKGVGYFIKGEQNKAVKPSFKINFKKDEIKTLYIRMTSKFPFFTSFNLFDKNSYQQYNYKFDIIYALFLGSIFSLILYNLVIYFFTKDITYLYYVLYSSLFLSWQLMLTGFFPLNTFSSTSSFYHFGMLIPLFLAFLMLFSRSILDTKVLFPKIDLTLKLVAYFYFLLAFISISYINFTTAIINSTTLFILPYLLFVGFKSHLKGNKTAKFYIIAQIFFLIMSTLFSFAADGFFEYNLITRHSIILGYFIENILFSLALAYRIRVLEEEKISIISKSNIELDAKVKERTKELEESKEKLEELANKDSMTNLYNRRVLFEYGEKLISFAKRENSPISIIMFDIDNFKSINDTFGHTVGDIVIKRFAELLKNLRASDIVSRFGGEEFVVLLPNTDKETAYKLALEIKKLSEDLIIEIEGNNSFNFTVSGGVDSLELNNEDDDINTMILRADNSLYRAKDGGRNKIVLS